MPVYLLFFDRLYLDFSFVFYFWAGACLVRHSPAVRICVIVVSTLAVVMCVTIVVCATIFGTGNMCVTFGRRIENPPIEYVVAMCAFLSFLAGFPLALLLTQQAKNEFTRK